MNINIVIIILMAAVWFFFIIRPQSVKQKNQKQFIQDLKKGDKVVTNGGIHGKVAELKDLTVIIDLGGGAKMKINRAAISMEATALENSQESTS